MISQDKVDATWQAWHDENAHRVCYRPITINKTNTRDICTFTLNRITPRIRFILYTDRRGGDVNMLSRDNEIWDFLLWLDNPGGDSRHDMIADTFEPFLKWTNALNRVDRIDLIGAFDQGVRATRFMSQPDPHGNRVPLVYDPKTETFQPLPESISGAWWICFDEIEVHR